MFTENIAHMIQDTESLQAVYVSTLPDGLLYDTWTREDLSWNLTDAVSGFGELVETGRDVLGIFGAESPSQMLIESPSAVIVLRELGKQFLACLIFDRETPLGLVRLHTQRLLQGIQRALPSHASDDLDRGAQLLDYLENQSPDPHASRLRISLQTGITIDQLEEPEGLTHDQVALLEQAICDIMGLDEPPV